MGGAAWAGSLIGTAKVSPSGQLQLQGGYNCYVQLPVGILGSPSPPSVSIEVWITTLPGAQSGYNSASGSYTRIFQFGGHTANSNAGSIIISRDGNTGNFQFLTTPDAKNYYGADFPLNFDGATNLYIAIVISSSGGGSFYMNGALAFTVSGLSIPTGTVGELNYLGFGYDGGSPGFSGSVDEFRVWQGALSAADIATHYNVGPNSTFD